MTTVIELGNDILDLIDYDDEFTDWSRDLAAELLERYEISRKPEPWPTTLGSFVELEYHGHKRTAILMNDRSSANTDMWKLSETVDLGEQRRYWGLPAKTQGRATLIRVIHLAPEQ